MNPENPFLYLQRSAETNPNGVFSRSLVQTMTNADAVVEVKRIAFELRAGRASEVINAGGVKLDPARLDGVALHYPGVEDACTFGYEASSGLEAIGLAVVVADGFDADALVEHLRHEFGVAAPTLVARVAQVPRTRAGKPLRRELAERYSGS